MSDEAALFDSLAAGLGGKVYRSWWWDLWSSERTLSWWSAGRTLSWWSAGTLALLRFRTEHELAWRPEDGRLCLLGRLLRWWCDWPPGVCRAARRSCTSKKHAADIF